MGGEPGLLFKNPDKMVITQACQGGQLADGEVFRKVFTDIRRNLFRKIDMGIGFVIGGRIEQNGSQDIGEIF